MPSIVEPLPGTPRHQALLRAIVEAYEHDERVLAIGVLGSLGRGTWDQWSDLDLDIVTTGEIDAIAEAHRLGGPDALVLPTRPGEVDVVLRSLEEFSIRYHPLGTTNAHIVDDLKIVSGTLSCDQILAAGVRESRQPRTLDLLASEALRFAIGVHIRVQRHFRLDVADGRLQLARGRLANPAAVIDTDPATQRAVAFGRQSLADALRSARLGIQGNQDAAARLLNLFAAP
jgi:hypothetical protein